MDRFYLFDVYGSPWFSAIYILLFISLIGCVLPRTIEHFHAARALPPATPKNLNRMEFYSTWPAVGNELELARAWFKSQRFRVLEKMERFLQKKVLHAKPGIYFSTWLLF